MLVQPRLIPLWHSLSEHDVQRDDTKFVRRAEKLVINIEQKRASKMIYLTPRSSSNGTISSTNPFGDFPSGV